MNIYEGREDLGIRLTGDSFPHYQDRDPHADYFLVVHSNDNNESVLTDLPSWSQDEHCQGVLYVRGLPYGGVDEELRARAAREYRFRKGAHHTPQHWVHFLSYAVGSGHRSRVVEERFRAFFRRVREQHLIAWNLIDPERPVNLIALYVLTLALRDLDQAQQQNLLSQKEVWEPIWRVGAAEYTMKSCKGLPSRAGFSVKSAGAIGDYLEDLLYDIGILPNLSSRKASEAEELRSAVSHDWIGNKVLEMNPAVDARPAEFTQHIASGGYYDQSLDRLDHLVETMVDWYSPAGLVDEPPLSAFTPETQRQIAAVLHERYVQSTPEGVLPTAEAQAKLREASSDVRAQFESFRETWRAGSTHEECKQAWVRLQKAALEAKDLLNRLPKGLAIPT